MPTTAENTDLEEVDEETEEDNDTETSLPSNDTNERVNTTNDDTNTQPIASLAATLSLDPQKQLGIIQGLAATIGVKGTILLAIAKTNVDQLLVTIQTVRAPDEEGASALPLQVSGTPAEIDNQLIDALAHYVPARVYAVATATDIANNIATAAKHAKAEADKKRNTPSTKTTRTANATVMAPPPVSTADLTVTVTPQDATIIIRDKNNAAVPIEHSVSKALPLGRYTISGEQTGYTSSAPQVVQLTKNQTIYINLQPADNTLFS